MSGTETEVMGEILKWLEFMGRQEAVGVVNDALDFGGNEQKEQAAKIAYQLTNGENSTRHIAEQIQFGKNWVSNRHQEWATLGIVRKDGPRSPYEHILSLDELGIDYPEIPESET
jgi:hypothetical protein